MEVDELANLSSHSLRAETELTVLAHLYVDISRSASDEAKDAKELKRISGGFHGISLLVSEISSHPSFIGLMECSVSSEIGRRSGPMTILGNARLSGVCPCLLLLSF